MGMVVVMMMLTNLLTIRQSCLLPALYTAVFGCMVMMNQTELSPACFMVSSLAAW